MQKDHALHFQCLNCKTPVNFSLFEVSNNSVHCEACGKIYAFSDPTLIRQLQKFEALCRQIHASEEILGQSSIGIDVDGHQVKVPFKILLTRLSSSLELKMQGQSLFIHFRTEPARLMTTR